MEYSFVQLIALGGGTALCLLALAVLSPRTVARVTEAVLDRVEIVLARRTRRRAARADESIHLSLFDSYRQERAHR
jgi:heme exporter protein D